jgi:WD40 repeat protein
VAFSPDGRLLATASDDGSARVWEWAGGQERARVTHDEAVRGVAFSPDGGLLATASRDHTARVWALVR